MKKILQEFKTFAMQGSVVDLAVGIIIGGAFGKIIDSLVKDVIMPPIGLLLGKVDFTNLYVQLTHRDVTYPSLNVAQQAGAVTINYGIFLNMLITFIIVALAIFFLIRFINRLKEMEHKEKTEAIVKKCPFCDMDIPIKAIKCPDCTADLWA